MLRGEEVRAVQLSVEPGALAASSTGVGDAAEVFAAMSRSVRSSSLSAAGAAGTEHARAGLTTFGEHWGLVLSLLGAAGEVVQQQLDAAARRYVAVDDDVARAAS